MLLWYLIIGMVVAGLFNSLLLNAETFYAKAKDPEAERIFLRLMGCVQAMGGMQKTIAIVTVVCLIGWPMIVMGFLTSGKGRSE